MKWNAFLKVGAGIAIGGVLAACGGGGHDGGKVDPEPQPGRAVSGALAAAPPIAAPAPVPENGASRHA